MKRIIAALLAAAVLTAPALAQTKLWPVGNGQVNVTFKGESMADAPGRARLLAAVTRAANLLCRDVQPAVDQRACVADTVQRSARDAPRGSPLPRALAERDAASGQQLAALGR